MAWRPPTWVTRCGFQCLNGMFASCKIPSLSTLAVYLVAGVLRHAWWSLFQLSRGCSSFLEVLAGGTPEGTSIQVLEKFKYSRHRYSCLYLKVSGVLHPALHDFISRKSSNSRKIALTAPCETMWQSYTFYEILQTRCQRSRGC